jgi:phage terminase large subunit
MNASQLFQLNYNYPEWCKLTINRGGSGSGKTYSIMQVLSCIAIRDKGAVITVVGQDIPNLKKGAIRDMRNVVSSTPEIAKWIKYYNKTDKEYHFLNGSILEFASYDDEQDAKNGKRDYLFCNEVNGLSKEIFEALRIRTSKHVWVDFNPSSSFWLHKEGYEQRKDTRVIVSTYKHNPFLSKKQVTDIEGYEPTPENEAAGTADKYRWMVYGLGQYAAREGAIFTRWMRGDFDESLPYLFGIDWGVRDQFAFVKVAVNPKKKLLFVQELCYETDLNSAQILKRVQRNCSKSDLLICDSAQLISINDLRHEDYNAEPAFKRPGIVSERIKWIKDYMIVVCGNSHNLESELNEYVWSNKAAEIPVDKKNHLIDAMSYAFTYLKLNVLE